MGQWFVLASRGRMYVGPGYVVAVWDRTVRFNWNILETKIVVNKLKNLKHIIFRNEVSKYKRICIVCTSSPLDDGCCMVNNVNCIFVPKRGTSGLCIKIMHTRSMVLLKRTRYSKFTNQALLKVAI